MAGSPVTDWRQVYAEASDAMRVGVAAFFGGAPEDKPEQYAASSPITTVARVRAPVLIIQGRNDSRTPARPVEEYATQLRAVGKQIELHWYETGHLGPLLQVEESIHHQELMLAFAQRVCNQPTARARGSAAVWARFCAAWAGRGSPAMGPFVHRRQLTRLLLRRVA